MPWNAVITRDVIRGSLQITYFMSQRINVLFHSLEKREDNV